MAELIKNSREFEDFNPGSRTFGGLNIFQIPVTALNPDAMDDEYTYIAAAIIDGETPYEYEVATELGIEEEEVEMVNSYEASDLEGDGTVDFESAAQYFWSVVAAEEDKEDLFVHPDRVMN